MHGTFKRDENQDVQQFCITNKSGINFYPNALC